MAFKWLLLAFIIQFTNATVQVPKVKLNDGREMPALALGTWLGLTDLGMIRPTSNEVEQAVRWALDAGYTHIDTAWIYRIEDQVGRALKGVPREKVFVTTKLWNTFHARDAVVPALRESLRSLQLDYVDLYLIHSPIGHFVTILGGDLSLSSIIIAMLGDDESWKAMVSFCETIMSQKEADERVREEAADVASIRGRRMGANLSYDTTDYLDTWQGMIEAKKLGLTKSIGLSNFNQNMIRRILENGLEKPAALQVELNLNLQQPDLVAYCKSQNIAVMAYTPFGSLFYSKAAPDAPPPRVDDPALVKIAEKYNKTVPQVALRYLVELGTVPLPKSLTKSRIEQNIDIFDFQLTDDEKNLLKTFDKGYYTFPLYKWQNHP